MLVDDFRLPAQWTVNRSDGSVALFQNASGDTLSINHFRLKPDIAADISDAEALRAFWRSRAEASGVAMLEVDPIRVAGLPAVRTVLKVRLQPRGFAFIGSVTLPFADCSYVLKAESVERGITGLRESMVMAALNPRSSPAIRT
jgi:hypothetical protein